jgi:hypothetical protein
MKMATVVRPWRPFCRDYRHLQNSAANTDFEPQPPRFHPPLPVL